MASDKIIRSYKQPFLKVYWDDFENVSFLCRDEAFDDAALCLLQVVEKELSPLNLQNKLRLQYYTARYLKEICGIGRVDQWVGSDYVYSIVEYYCKSTDPVVWLFRRIDELQQFSSKQGFDT